jgi:tripartite-type tricarboxylate transporter receptor subunit TctC
MIFKSLALIATACLSWSASTAWAQQGYPNKPIRLVVPWGVGTPGDVAGRILAEKLTASLGQPVVIDNKPGAAGTIGLADVLRQPADGYTLFDLSSASLVAPLLYPTQNINFEKTLDPVAHIMWHYNVLVTPVNSPIKSPADIVEMSKKDPGSLTFASGGNGTPAHLAGELFRQQTGAQTTHVPYNQFPVGIGDVIAGRISFMFLTGSAAVPQITAGKLKPLAVTGGNRLTVLKDVPTMGEMGFKDFTLRSFESVMVKAGTPKEIVARLNAEFNKALQLPDVRERLTALAVDIDPMSPEKLEQVVRTESERWTRIGTAAKIKAD